MLRALCKTTVYRWLTSDCCFLLHVTTWHGCCPCTRTGMDFPCGYLTLDSFSSKENWLGNICENSIVKANIVTESYQSLPVTTTVIFMHVCGGNSLQALSNRGTPDRSSVNGGCSSRTQYCYCCRQLGGSLREAS